MEVRFAIAILILSTSTVSQWTDVNGHRIGAFTHPARTSFGFDMTTRRIVTTYLFENENGTKTGRTDCWC